MATANGNFKKKVLRLCLSTYRFLGFS